MLPNALTVKCNGEAHSNGMIDNCSVCLPYWGFYPVCPKCHWKLRQGKTGKYFCGSCGRKYTWDRNAYPDPNQATCSECPEFHQFKKDEAYGYCPFAEGTVRGDDPVCDDGKEFLKQ